MCDYNKESIKFNTLVNEIYTLNYNKFSSKQELIDLTIQKLELNEKPNQLTVAKNHKLIKKYLKQVCDKFNELEVNYYIVGALAVYLSQNKLIRYHDDIDLWLKKKISKK